MGSTHSGTGGEGKDDYLETTDQNEQEVRSTVGSIQGNTTSTRSSVAEESGMCRKYVFWWLPTLGSEKDTRSNSSPTPTTGSRKKYKQSDCRDILTSAEKHAQAEALKRENPLIPSLQHSFVINSYGSTLLRLPMGGGSCQAKINFPPPRLGSKPSSLIRKHYRVDEIERFRLGKGRANTKHMPKNVRQKRNVFSVSSLKNLSQRKELREFWTDVLHNWEEKHDKEEVLAKWRLYGIPSDLRGSVWANAIGNMEHLTSADYEKYIKDFDPTIPLDELLQTRTNNGLSNIDNDITRIFESQNLRPSEENFLVSLRKVIFAFVQHQPKNFSQPLAYIASMLLIYMNPETAFIALVNLVNLPTGIFLPTGNFQHVLELSMVFDQKFRENLPFVHKHFQKQNVQSDTFFINWVLTLFTQPLPFPLASRVWDAFFSEGDSILVRTAIVILSNHEHQLTQLDQKMIQKILLTDPHIDINEDRFMSALYNIQWEGDPTYFEKIEVKKEVEPNRKGSKLKSSLEHLSKSNSQKSSDSEGSDEKETVGGNGMEDSWHEVRVPGRTAEVPSKFPPFKEGTPVPTFQNLSTGYDTPELVSPAPEITGKYDSDNLSDDLHHMRVAIGSITSDADSNCVTQKTWDTDTIFPMDEE